MSKALAISVQSWRYLRPFQFSSLLSTMKSSPPDLGASLMASVATAWFRVGMELLSDAAESSGASGGCKDGKCAPRFTENPFSFVLARYFLMAPFAAINLRRPDY